LSKGDTWGEFDVMLAKPPPTCIHRATAINFLHVLCIERATLHTAAQNFPKSLKAMKVWAFYRGIKEYLIHWNRERKRNEAKEQFKGKAGALTGAGSKKNAEQRLANGTNGGVANGTNGTNGTDGASPAPVMLRTLAGNTKWRSMQTVLRAKNVLKAKSALPAAAVPQSGKGDYRLFGGDVTTTKIAEAVQKTLDASIQDKMEALEKRIVEKMTSLFEGRGQLRDPFLVGGRDLRVEDAE